MTIQQNAKEYANNMAVRIEEYDKILAAFLAGCAFAQSDAVRLQAVIKMLEARVKEVESQNLRLNNQLGLYRPMDF